MLSEQALLKYKRLQATYHTSLKDKRILLQRHWTAFERSEHPEVALEKLHLFVHRLAGSAAPYGYKNLSSLSQEVERLVNEYAGGNLAYSPDGQTKKVIREQLRTEVARLTAALDDAFCDRDPGRCSQ